jgi:hypothetical protein
MSSSFTIPLDDLKRSKILELNSFRGFQSPVEGKEHNDQYIYVCLVNGKPKNYPNNGEYERMTEMVAQEIKQELQLQTLIFDDFIGKNFFKIHWSERYSMEAVLTAIIQKGYNIQLCTKTLPSFGPSHGDTSFSFQDIEPRLISVMTQSVTSFGIRILKQYDVLLEPWNFHTVQGKKQCNIWRCMMGQDKMTQDEENNHKDNFYFWPIWKGQSLPY